MQQIDQQTLEQWAQSHETDIAIAEAIFYLADERLYAAERIWQEPTDAEVIAIWERATQNGLKGDDLPWGSGNLAEAMKSISDDNLTCQVCAHAGQFTKAVAFANGQHLCQHCADSI